MNDEDDMIMENGIATTLNETGMIETVTYDFDVELNENLDQTTVEDIILTRILGQKPNAVVTRSRYVRHQYELYVYIIEATKYHAKDNLDLDYDDVDIIDIISEPITASSSSTITTKKGKKRDLRT
jgi:hypothetical protein